MKKSKTMRLASGLLVLTLLSTCMVAGTFAKYTSEGSGTDTARVAKFGVTVNADAAENDDSLAAFSKTYAKTESTTSTSITNSVSANEKVVAPGTTGEMTKVKLSGSPEVAVKVNYAGQFAIDENWKVNEAFYCPLVVTVKSSSGTTVVKQSDSINSAAAFNKAVNDAIAAYSQEYAPGQDLSNIGNDALTVSWNWPFADNAEGTKQTDANDTALGNLETAPTVKLDVTTTVTQID